MGGVFPRSSGMVPATPRSSPSSGGDEVESVSDFIGGHMGAAVGYVQQFWIVAQDEVQPLPDSVGVRPEPHRGRAAARATAQCHQARPRRRVRHARRAAGTHCGGTCREPLLARGELSVAPSG